MMIPFVQCDWTGQQQPVLNITCYVVICYNSDGLLPRMPFRGPRRCSEAMQRRGRVSLQEPVTWGLAFVARGGVYFPVASGVVSLGTLLDQGTHGLMTPRGRTVLETAPGGRARGSRGFTTESAAGVAVGRGCR